MNCDEVRSQLSAWLDGEQDGDASAQTEAHLAACADCAAVLQELVRQEAKLRRLFAADRAAADRLADRVLAEPSVALRSFGFPLWRQALTAVFALAAGFLLALLLPRPTPPLAASSAPTPAGAELVLATGAIEVGDARGWRELAAGQTAPIGCSLRTPEKVACELKFPQGAEIRLAGGTEVQLISAQQIKLAQGQLWSNVNASSQPFEVLGKNARVAAKRSRFDFAERPDGATVTALEGSAQWSAGGRTAELAAGHRLRVADGKAETDRLSLDEMVHAESWLNELLRRKGPNDPELKQRVECLFAQIGQSKMDYLREDELRILGESCVLPLLRYVQGPESQGNPEKRRLACRLVADLAPTWAIGDLIGLLEDPDPKVKSSAAAGLKRLTGQTQGLEPPQWSSASPEACGAAQDGWRQWWQRNQFRCPSSPDEVGSSRAPIRSPSSPDIKASGTRTRGRG